MKNAMKNGIVDGVKGGKVDDITVVVFKFADDVKRGFFAKL